RARPGEAKGAPVLGDERVAATGPAGARAGAGLRAGAVAVGTGGRAGEPDGHGHALGGFPEFEGDLGFYVRAPAALALAPPASAAEAAKATWGTAKAAAHAAGGDHGLQLVVFLALLLIAHDGVGLGSCLKAVLGRGIPGVLIRVVVPRDLAVGLLNLLAAGAFAHTEVLVIILVYPFTVHCLLPSF